MMKKRKEGFILLSVVIMAIVASILTAVIITKIQNNMNLTVLSMEKVTLEKNAGNAFTTIYTYFRDQYHDHYIFNFNDFQQSATPTWFSNFKSKTAGGTSLESQAWNEFLSNLTNPFYAPKTSLQNLLKSVSGNGIQAILTPLNDYNNLLFVIIRAYSNRQSAYFFGFISPKYFTNWAVFALEGVNGYYSYGEMIDGPSYFGEDLGIQYKVTSGISGGKNYIDFAGPYFNGMVDYGNLKRWDDGHPSSSNGKKVYVNDLYVGYGCVGPYEGQLNGKDDGKKWLIVSYPYKIVEVDTVEYEDSSMIKVKGYVIDPNKELIPPFFPAGGNKLSDSKKQDMASYFNQIDSIYGTQVHSMTEPASIVFEAYKNGQSLTNSSSGVYLNDFTWNDGTYNYSENAKDITVITDVMKANVAANTYGITLPSTFVTSDATVQVTEIKWSGDYISHPNDKKQNGNVAQVIITPISSLKNSKPPWSSMTFFVYYQGQSERKLMFPEIGAVPYNFNGVISAYRNVSMGGEGIPGGQGNQGSQQVSTLYGKYTLISETGDVSLKGDIIYGGLYNDLKGHIGHSLLDDGVDLNALIKKNHVNSMLNIVSLGGSIYVPQENPQPKNPIITANLLTFGSGPYNGSYSSKRGHLWIQNYYFMNNEGYRQIFGSIVSRAMDPTFTFTGWGTNWSGYKEYNVYDRRLYVNEDLPLATPQTNDVIYFGMRMM